MASNRIGRINEEIQRELAQQLRLLKDPRVQKTMVSITHVEATPDLRYAKVYVSLLDRSCTKEVLAGLKSSGGFLRRARALLRDGGELRLRDGAEKVHVGERLLPRKRRAADAAAVSALRIPRAAAAAPRAVQHQWREA